MQIEVINHYHRGLKKEIEFFLNGVRFLNYWWIKNIERQKLINYTLAEIEVDYRCEKKIIVARENKEISGLLTFRKIFWDSQHFGYPVGKIEHFFARGNSEDQLRVKDKMIKFLLKSMRQSFKFLSIRVNTNDLSSVHCLEKNGFNLITAELMYAWFKEKIADYREKIVELGKPCKVRKYKINDLPSLLDMAKYFTTNRLVSDYRISPDKARGVYEEWIKNACQNTLSGQDEVLVGEVNKKVVAFTTAKIETNNLLGFSIGIPGLVGVLPDFRGRNINPYLMLKAIFCLFKKCEIVSAPSHITNIVMINSEHKAGAQLVDTSYLFHHFR